MARGGLRADCAGAGRFCARAVYPRAVYPRAVYARSVCARSVCANDTAGTAPSRGKPAATKRPARRRSGVFGVYSGSDRACERRSRDQRAQPKP